MTPRLSKVFELSGTEALLLNHEYIAPAHLLMGLIREGGGTAVECLTALGIALDQLRGQVRHLLSRAQPGSVDVPPTLVLPALPVLDQSGRNLTTEAREGRLDPVIGRRAELTRLIQVLLLRTRNSAMLVGETGVGKTTLAEGLCPGDRTGEHAVAAERRPAPRSRSGGVRDRFPRRDRPADAAGETAGRAQRRKDVILFIEDVQTLIGGGDTEHAINTAAVLKPMLLRGELRLIVTTTPAEHRRFLEKNAALQRRFQPIEVAEPTVAQTLEILTPIGLGRSRMPQQHLDRLTSIDASFLHQEGPSSHMHIGGVLVFEGPPPEFADYLGHVRGRLHLVPRYRQKLAIPPLETGRPLWVDDPNFNLEYHVRHAALPSPGTEQQLLQLTARIASHRSIVPSLCGRTGSWRASTTTASR